MFPLVIIALLLPPAAPGQSSQPVPVTVKVAPLVAVSPPRCLDTPADLACGHQNLDVDLVWLGSENPRDVSAILTLQTSQGALQRTVDVTGHPARVHFPFAAGAKLHTLEILWPDGNLSVVTELTPQTLLQIVR